MSESGDSNLKEMDGLYHCTSLPALTSIFKSRAFYPFFCLEEASYLKNPLRFAFAVVCFADLRRSELKEHMANFSSDVYVKMSKAWAIRKNISPVTYYSSKSTLSSAIYRSLIDYASDKQNVPEIYNPVNLMLGLLKQYSGHYFDKKRNQFSSREVCFYLEREWRYLPLVMDREAFYLEEKDYLNESLRKAKQKELVDHKYVADFTWDDILEVGGSFKHSIALVNILSKLFSISRFEAASKIRCIW
jgi:hypothetical protein